MVNESDKINMKNKNEGIFNSFLNEIDRITREVINDENKANALIDNLNKVQGIKFNKHLFLDNAILFRCDCSNNIVVESEMKDYIDSLYINRVTDKYSVVKYTHGGLVFTRNVTKGSKFRERMTIYPKYKEIFNDKEILKYINPDNFKHVLRFETNLSTFTLMRKAFNFGNNRNKLSELYGNTDTDNMIKLKDVLESKENPNLKLLTKITKEYPRIMKEYQGMKYSEVEKYEGSKRIIEIFNYDIAAIKVLINSKVKGNNSARFRDYIALMIDMRKEKAEGKGVVPDKLLEELREKLKTA